MDELKSPPEITFEFLIREFRQNNIQEILNLYGPSYLSEVTLTDMRIGGGLSDAGYYAAVELANHNFDGKESFFKEIITSPDEMLDIADLIISGKNNGKGKLPNAIKRAFSSIIETYSIKTLSEHANLGLEVNMYDLINLCHPKSTPDIKAFMTGNKGKKINS